MEIKEKIEAVKTLRKETGAGIAMCKLALEEVGFDIENAKVVLKRMGHEKVEGIDKRSTSAGCIGIYRHHDLRKAALVCLECETDFVARTEEFRSLADNLALQVVGMECSETSSLLSQPFLAREGNQTVEEAMKELSSKCGEKIHIGKIELKTV